MKSLFDNQLDSKIQAQFETSSMWNWWSGQSFYQEEVQKKKIRSNLSNLCLKLICWNYIDQNIICDIFLNFL